MPPTGRRNGWKVGDSLAVDDLTGHTYYRSELTKTFYGQLIAREHLGEEGVEHPQLKVRALRDPYPLSDPRPDAATSVACVILDAYLVQGKVQPIGAAAHLFPNPLTGGIEDMQIQASGGSCGTVSARAFVVR